MRMFLKWFPSLKMKLSGPLPFYWPQIPGSLVSNNFHSASDFLFSETKSFAQHPVFKGISIPFKTKIKIPAMNQPRFLYLTSCRPSSLSSIHMSSHTLNGSKDMSIPICHS